MKAVCVQLDIVWEDKPRNFARVRALLDRAGVEPGGLIVLPEMFATGFSMNVAAIAEDDSRPTESFLSELARRHRCHVLGGLVTRLPDGRGRNEAAAFDDMGRPLARYAKMHPFSLVGEAQHYAPGAGPVTFGCGDFTVAPFVCYDLRFPEVFRHAVAMGANLLAVIACWPQPRESHWVTLLKARAIENQAYVVGVNRTGKDPGHTYAGLSMIVDPQGEVLADAGSEEGTISAELSRQSLENWRRDFPALADIRPEYRREARDIGGTGRARPGVSPPPRSEPPR